MDAPKVLIVDDDALLLKLIGSYLSRNQAQFVPVFADSVKQAKSALAGDNIAAMITDIMLPDGNGVELLSHTQRNHPHVACLVQSAHVRGLQSVLTTDALTVLEKPFQPSHFAETVEAVLRRQDRPPNRMHMRDYLLMVEFLAQTCQLKIGVGDRPMGSMLLYRGRMADAFFGDKTGLDAALGLTSLSDPWVEMEAFQFKVAPTRKIDLEISEILMAQSRQSEAPPKIDPDKPLDLEDLETSDTADNVYGAVEGLPTDFYARAEHLCSQVAKGMRASDGFLNLALFGDVSQLVGFWNFDERSNAKGSVMQLMQTLADFTHSLGQLGFGDGSQILYNAKDGILIGTMSPPESPHAFTLLLKANLPGKMGLYRLKMETLASDLREMAMVDAQLKEVS